MPELPEVEIVCRNLNELIIGKEILHTKKNRTNLRKIIPQDLEVLTAHTKITFITRRAKYILIELSQQYSIIIHLGMTGRLTYYDQPHTELKHDHVVFYFTDNTSLVFNDARRFGMVDIVLSNQVNDLAYIKSLGIEPLSDDFTVDYLFNILHHSKLQIKKFLMDNKFIVGIGNIYASEILFRARINPTRITSQISYLEAGVIFKEIKETLNEAIILGGSSLKDYRNVLGIYGNYQNNFKIYGKNGKNCSSCKNIIIKVVMAGRASFYCEFCQK